MRVEPSLVMVFFFQAEDGIRDHCVTGVQTCALPIFRLVLRLAALYGEQVDSADVMKHARELVVTMAGGLSLRYLAEQAAKAIPFGGDFVAGAIASAATWAIGEVALEYYEGGREISPQRLRLLYADFYQRFRKQKTVEEVRQYALEGKDTPLELEAPG